MSLTKFAAGSIPGETHFEYTEAQRERRRALIFPREHGAWGMLLVPLLTGAGVGLVIGGEALYLLLLAIAVVALFWLRTPLESWIGAGAVRAQTQAERRLALFFLIPLGLLATLSLTLLFYRAPGQKLLLLGVLAGAAFLLQIWLKRMGRPGRMISEIAGAAALTATAPAAFCVATGRLDATAFTLWVANWLFAADQIHFVWLRIRGARAADRFEKLRLGKLFIVGNLLLSAGLTVSCYLRLGPVLMFVAFVPVSLRGATWFFTKPKPIALRRLGWSELGHALLFGTLLVFMFASSTKNLVP